jgi:superkiller protein 3
MKKTKKIKSRRRKITKRPPKSAPSASKRTVRLLVPVFIICAALAGIYFGLVSNRSKEEQPKSEKATKNSIEQPAEKPDLSTLTIEQQFALLKEEEMELARQVLNEFPNRDDSYVLMGDLYGRHGNSAEAMEFWEKSVEMNPNRFDAYRNMGRIAMETERYDKAVEFYEKAVEIKPRAAGVRSDIARVLMDSGKYGEAIEVIEEEIKYFPTSFTAHFQLAEAYRQEEEYERAIEHYEKTISLNPEHSHAHYGLAKVYTKRGERDKAKEHLAGFRKLRSKVTAAYMARRRGPIEDLAALRESVVRTYLDAEQVYRAGGDIGKAEALLKRAYEIDPENSRCLERLAFLYYRTNRGAKALEYFEKAAAAEPNNPYFRLNVGQVADGLKMFGKAEQAFKKSIELAPGKAAGYEELARLYLYNRRNLPRAKQLAQRALSLEKTAENYFLFGWASDVNGEKTAALKAMEQAVRLEPENRQYRRIYEQIKARKSP